VKCLQEVSIVLLLIHAHQWKEGGDAAVRLFVRLSVTSC